MQPQKVALPLESLGERCPPSHTTAVISQDNFHATSAFCQSIIECKSDQGQG
jgi:hypothetical protein